MMLLLLLYVVVIVTVVVADIQMYDDITSSIGRMLLSGLRAFTSCMDAIIYNRFLLSVYGQNS